MARLIRRTARTQQRLLLLNLGCTLLLGMSEAFLFSIVYKTLGILTRSTMPDTPGGLADNGGQNVLLWLFFILVLQLISSLCLAMGGILSGRFAARCQADVAPEIHRFILRLSYGCASK